MNIRTYADADLRSVVELFTASVHGLAVDHYDQAQRAAWAPTSPDLKEWKERLSGLQTHVAEENNVLAGFISYRPNGHIEFLYTSPDHCRKGVASSLYLRVEAILSATRTRELYTEASLVARPFFERQGFHVEQEQMVTRRNVVFRRFQMRKRLDGNR